MSRKVSSWSYSTLKSYKQCPLKVKLAKIDGIREPSSPAMERGTNIHQLCEDYVKAGDPSSFIPTDLRHFDEKFRALAKAGAMAEEEWGFTREWKQCSWSDPACWLRMKIDVHLVIGTCMTLVDYKTGKKYDDHKGQLSFYALGAFLRNPWLEKVRVELWYLDSGDAQEDVYEASELPDMLEWWKEQATPLLNDEQFAPRPGPHCRWCFYSASKNGNCEF